MEFPYKLFFAWENNELYKVIYYLGMNLNAHLQADWGKSKYLV